MDVLSDVLAAIRLTGAIFFDSTFRNEWVAEAHGASISAHQTMPDAQYVFYFHTLIEGACWVELTDGSMDPIRLNSGDVISFPMDDAHVLCSKVGMRAGRDVAIVVHATDRQLPYLIRQGRGEASCRFVFGYLGCDVGTYNPFINALPRVLLGRGAANQAWLSHLVNHAVFETERHDAGSEIVLAKMAELLLIEIIREHVDGLPEGAQGWLSGLRHPQIGHALRLIHGRPSEGWTIDHLAREVGLSRSVFADRFTHFAGVTPMQYLARWRMQLAARRLETAGVSVAQAGAEVGYESEAAFNRAFKKIVGVPPGSWRRKRTSGLRTDELPIFSSEDLLLKTVARSAPQPD